MCSATATSLLGHELRELLKADIVSEVNHAVFLADKIAALGGEVKIQPTLPKKVRSAKEMLEENAKAERSVVTSYTERISQAEEFGDKGTGHPPRGHPGGGNGPRRRAGAVGPVI